MTEFIGGRRPVIEALAAGRTAHLLLVSSYLPEVGQSLSDFGDGGPAPFLDVDPVAGTFGVRPELLVDTFLHDCDPDVQARAAEHLARQSVQVTGQPVGAAAWQQVPSTYLVCTEDRGTPARLQREFARRAGSVGVQPGSTARNDSGSASMIPTSTSPTIRPPTGPSRSPSQSTSASLRM